MSFGKFSFVSIKGDVEARIKGITTRKTNPAITSPAIFCF